MVIAKSGGQFELSCEPRKKVCVYSPDLRHRMVYIASFPSPHSFCSTTNAEGLASFLMRNVKGRKVVEKT